MFGEMKADRFLRKVREEVALMEQESHEDAKELNDYDWSDYGLSLGSFGYNYPKLREEQTYFDDDYDDFDFELSLRS